MPNSVVEQIKERVDIVSLLESYIKLEKSGANFKACCPFHAEKTPSFFVSPVRGSYYCFGCSAKGDIFSFVEQFEGLDFKGALKVLAERAGVELKPERPEVRTERDRMYSILEDVTILFEENLRTANADYAPDGDFGVDRARRKRRSSSRCRASDRRLADWFARA